MPRSVVDMRLLELRSGLFFEYPKLKRTDKNLLFFLPFWENPIIGEKKEAKLVEYNLINRGSTMFTHTGAGAREITIEFNLTIPHIMRSVNSVQNAERLIKSLSTQKEKERFNNINPFVLENSPSVAEDNVRLWQQLRYESEVGVIAEHDAIRFEKLKQARADATTVVDESVSHLFQVPAAAPLHEGFDALQGGAPLANLSKTALTALNAAVFILETIRTCVAGNSTNTLLGPPLLRLRHGASYNDVPLICRDYDISVDQDAGYDLKTLLPYRMTITLNTAELRTGDFKNFVPGQPVMRDTLAGWESLHTYGTTDPGYLRDARTNTG